MREISPHLSKWRSGLVYLPCLLALALAVCVTPRPLRANIAQVDMSNITFNGTGACPSSPCETFNISFDWNTASHSLVPGSMTVQSFGAFGNFTFKGETGSSLGTAFVWSDSQGLVLTLLTSCSPGQLGADCTPNLNQVDLTCTTSACAKDFGISGHTLYVHPNSGSISDPVLTPEPSLLLQLLLGLLFLGFFACWTRVKEFFSSQSCLSRETARAKS
jgi:hypothetical protein